MAIPRIYQAISDIQLQQTIQLDKAASHHLATVLRIKLQAEIKLFNGNGKEYHGIIKEIKKQQVSVDIQSMSEPATESACHLILAQGIAKGEKMDWIIQKAVELGVKAIYPLDTERTNVSLSGDRLQNKQQHWQKVAISAAEQCGRCVIPLVHPVMSVSGYLQLAEKAQYQGLILAPQAAQFLAQLAYAPTQALALMIGPEGGWSEKELALAKQFQQQSVALGPRILRTETASLAVLAVLQAKFGDLQG